MLEEKDAQNPENHDLDFYKDGVVPANTEESRKKTADFVKARRAEQRKDPIEEKSPEDKKNNQP